MEPNLQKGFKQLSLFGEQAVTGKGKKASVGDPLQPSKQPDPLMRPAWQLDRDEQNSTELKGSSQDAPPSLAELRGPALGETTLSKKDALHEKAEQALDELGRALESGKSEALVTYLTTMAKFHSYSFGNQLLIAFQRPDATHVAGFHKWKSLGRSVRKGERGIMILAPVTKKVGEVEETQKDGTKKTRDIRRIVNTKPVHVFDVAQTDGKPLPEFSSAKGDPKDETDKLRTIIRETGIELYYAERLPGGAQGVSEGKRIGCVLGLTPAEEFRTLVHELGHELLHRGERRQETTKRSRELEAEAVAFVVCTGIGLDVKQSSTDYIHLYRGSKAMLAESLEFIRQASTTILSHLKDTRDH